jgi:hypothetical protein
MPLEQNVLIALAIRIQKSENVSLLIAVFGFTDLVKIHLEKLNETESEKAIQFYFNGRRPSALFSNFS